ncbi:hypothetical protein EDC04DRAFT_2914018 [Pisolithus marmoratus]|nr:hypothetical protein EDC04DRAFT_2914018 [Pisolithus marmoratus]
MAKDNFLFPAIGANGVLQPGEPLSHDMVQKWIDKAVAGAGIPGTFSMHCYRHGGVQYQFMFVPVGQQWTLTHVRWWGGWADGEHNDHSDTLAPVSCEADGSFAGETALVQPASAETLNMVHASLTVEVAALHMKVEEVSSSQVTNMNEICQRLSNISNLVTSALTSTSACLASNPVDTATLACRHSLAWTTPLLPPTIQPSPATLFCLPPISSQPMQFTMLRLVQPLGASASASPFVFLPSQVGPHRTVRTRPSNLPQGLLIPNVPVLHANGMQTLKSNSWRDIVRHWMEGEPRLSLSIPLKDWPHHYYNRLHGHKFNTKSYQQSIIVTKFLNEFQGDEAAFLKAYGHAASEGHTRLLKAILDACKQHRGDGERRRHFTNKVCSHLLDATEQPA